MYGDVENGGVSGGHCFIKGHNISEANNPSYIYSTKKRDENFPDVSEMKYSGLQGGVGIYNMFYTFTLHQYANMK